MEEFKKDRYDWYSLTFLNKDDLKDDEIKLIFSRFGNPFVNIKHNRAFIRFREYDSAKQALDQLREKYDLDVTRDCKLPNHANHGANFLSNQEREFDSGGNVENRLISGHGPRRFNRMNSDQSNRMTNGISEKSDKDGPPELIESASTGVTYRLIIGNLPANVTLDEIVDLVEESEPRLVEHVEQTENLQLNFCVIHLDNKERVNYLAKKLDQFVYRKHPLIAMDAGELLSTVPT